MATLPNRKDIPLASLLEEISHSDGNPLLAIQPCMDMISEITGGSVEFVDASNPMVALMSTSACTYSAGVMENAAGLRRLYSNLATTEEDLYHHMDYKSYINRFSSPGTADITFNVSRTQFETFMVRVPNTDHSMIVIPRDTRLRVGNDLVFTLNYPIEIKFFDSQSIQINYNTDIPSPIQTLSTNIIEYRQVADPQTNEKWIQFTIPMYQTDYVKLTDTVQRGRYFVRTMDFTNQFYFARAFYRTEAAGRWVEMATTHSPQTYNPETPTMKFKVIGKTLTCSLPLVYQNTMGLMGELRVDCYTSLGDYITRMDGYEPNEYVLDMVPLDPQRDTSPYTAAATRVSIMSWSSGILTGGKAALTFQQLKDRVAYNSLGEQDHPITNIQLGAATENRGFELVPNVDVVTNRIFLATRRLPPPSDPRLMTSANIGIGTYVTEDPSKNAHPWVLVHGKRTTFLSKNLYQSTDGIIRLLTKAEVDSIDAMTNTAKINLINRNKYLYSPFYYVVDSNGLELDVRAYHLDSPVASNLNFVKQNATLQLAVNTGKYFFTKTDKGYNLTITTKSGFNYKNIADDQVQCQMGIRLQSSSRFAYWNGVLAGRTEDNERIYTFDIHTNYDIDEEGKIQLTNGYINDIDTTPMWANLSEDFHIFHTTSSIPAGTYRPDETQAMIGLSYLPTPVAAITHEIIQAKFGDHLKALWTRGRALPDMIVYKQYAIDVQKVLAKDEYDEDPKTGSSITVENGVIDYHLLGKKGDKVFDEDGNPVWQHRAGDVVKVDGEKVIDDVRVGTKELDMFFVDGRHYFVTDATFKDYNKEFIDLVVVWVLKDIPSINERTFEKTVVRFYPNNQLSMVNVIIGGGKKMTIESEQTLTVDVFVTDALYRDSEQRLRFEEQTIRYLDTWVSQPVVATSDAIDGLRTLYGDVSSGVSIKGLGGDLALTLVNMQRNEDRFCLKRNLSVQQDGTFIIKEGVTVNFYRSNPEVLK